MHNKKNEKKNKNFKKNKKSSKNFLKNTVLYIVGVRKTFYVKKQKQKPQSKILHPNYGTIVEKKQFLSWARNNSDMTFY